MGQDDTGIGRASHAGELGQPKLLANLFERKTPLATIDADLVHAGFGDDASQ
jgi:hypothetical protein